MDASVHQTQCFMGSMRLRIVDQRIGSHLSALVATGPILRCSDQLLAYPALPMGFHHVPAFDIADGFRGIATVGVRTQIHLHEPNQAAVIELRYQDRDRHGESGGPGQDLLYLLSVLRSR